ncbi:MULTISPECIES: hypothetical protein [unclassified Burkholderia]|uniref:hypothetical protein n=1 Tax=unclassified Burkholderia TaxID=2613784 RepID=UPI001269AEDC|nr:MULTISPECIES: hypothetical protein [unclassified Burkholderia]
MHDANPPHGFAKTNSSDDTGPEKKAVRPGSPKGLQIKSMRADARPASREPAVRGPDAAGPGPRDAVDVRGRRRFALRPTRGFAIFAVTARAAPTKRVAGRKASNECARPLTAASIGVVARRRRILFAPPAR